MPFGYLGIDCLNQIRQTGSRNDYTASVWNYLKYAAREKDNTPLFRFMMSDLTVRPMNCRPDTILSYRHSAPFISEYLHQKYTDHLHAELCHNRHHLAESRLLAQLIFYTLLPELHLLNPDIADAIHAVAFNNNSDAVSSVVLNKFEVENFVYNGITEPPASFEIFNTSHLLFLLPQDIMMVNTTQYTLDACSNCRAVFIKTHKSQKFCQSCGCRHTSYYRNTYQRKEPRKMHETIRNKLKTVYGPESLEYKQFLHESNYRWNALNDTTAAMTAAESYNDWLNAQLNTAQKAERAKEQARIEAEQDAFLEFAADFKWQNKDEDWY